MIDNGNKIQILHEFFARKMKLETIGLKKNRIRFELRNGKIYQIIRKTFIVPVKIENHEKKSFCHLADIENHILIVRDGWLQKHNFRSTELNVP